MVRQSLNLKLRVVLTMGVMILLVITAHTIGLITFVNSRSSLGELSRSLFGQISATTQEKVRGHFQPAVNVVREYQTLAERRRLPLDKLDELGLIFAERLRAESSLSEITYGDSLGNFVGSSRAKDGQVELRQSVPNSHGRSQNRRQLIAKNGQRSPLTTNKKSYDPRERPWYLLAAKSKDIVWTTPYTWSNGDMGITCAVALRKDSKVLGVLTADFRLNSLSKFLKTIKIGQTGQVFLMNRKGTVVAQSSESKKSLDPVKQLLSENKEWQEMPSLKPVFHDLEFGGQNYATEIQFFELEGGLDWATVIVVPEREFLGNVYKTARTTFLIAAIALLIAMIAAYLFAALLSNPMQQIANDLTRIGQFDLETPSLPSSVINEVEVMTSSVERMKASLRSFSHYVPRELVRQLVKAGKEAELGGELRVLTLHFSDIEGFTSISEGLRPQDLVTDLAQYLDTMVGVLTHHEGTIDKFMGDGILAFFNAPVPTSDHAIKSCHAALEAQRALALKREEWKSNNQPEFRARIGLHTGEVLVGNIGTTERFSYTVIGDAVNLAARLEALNKAYGTFIMASEETRRQSGDTFEWRRLDRVSVIGRAEGLDVYELLAQKGMLSEDQAQSRDRYESALSLFHDRQFSEAVAVLASLAEKAPEDKAIQLLQSRAKQCLDSPPGDDWTGVFKQLVK
ncbi:MAG: adenylate/guanylate cyclase domain-containing protein [Planctomycetota bacterium]|nr:adenylate/guanylate cyclase domain-containing protein [Planctomycetota bacterium]